MVTQGFLRKTFLYKEANLYWKKSRVGQKRTDIPAGSVNKQSGYRLIVMLCPDGKVRSFKAHRLIWIFFYGSIPDGMVIDHINGEHADNRLTNLRLTTRRANSQNQRRRQERNTKYKGVYYNKKLKKYSAHICAEYKQEYLGLFKTQDEAALAYNAAAARLHGPYACYNEVDCG